MLKRMIVVELDETRAQRLVDKWNALANETAVVEGPWTDDRNVLKAAKSIIEVGNPTIAHNMTAKKQRTHPHRKQWDIVLKPAWTKSGKRETFSVTLDDFVMSLRNSEVFEVWRAFTDGSPARLEHTCASERDAEARMKVFCKKFPDDTTSVKPRPIDNYTKDMHNFQTEGHVILGVTNVSAVEAIDPVTGIPRYVHAGRNDEVAKTPRSRPGRSVGS